MKKVHLVLLSGLFIGLSSPTVLFGWQVPNLGFLAWVGLIPLILALDEVTPWHAFRYGYLFGVVSFGISWYWLFNALHTFGHLPIFASTLVVILGVLMMSFYIGAACGLARYFVSKNKGPMIIWLPIFWALSEFARNYSPFGGFPWSPLSISQTAYLPFIQFADVTGAYGISFLLVWINAWGAQAIFKKKGKRTEFFLPKTIVTILFVGLAFGYGFYRLNQTNLAIAKAPHLKAALLQPNIPQDEKWDAATQEKQQAIFKKLVSQVENSADLVIWPEASWTNTLWIDDDKLAPSDIGLLVHHDPRPYTMLGLNYVTQKNGHERYFNSAAIIDAYGNVLDKYHKVHLVPFGEYTPFQKILTFITKPLAAIGDFEAGEAYHPLKLENFSIGPLICYEDIFPEISRSMARQQVSLLINLTNDAWYGVSSAPFQHLAMATLRSVETKRTMLRATNTGVTAVILPTGKVVVSSPIFEEGVVVYQAPLLTTNTLYTSLGDWFVVACFIFTLWQLIRPYVQRTQREI